MLLLGMFIEGKEEGMIFPEYAPTVKEFQKEVLNGILDNKDREQTKVSSQERIDNTLRQAQIYKDYVGRGGTD